MSKSNGGGSNLYRDPLPHYKFVRTLGIGAFGKVKLAVHTLTGLNVAIKILDRESINNLDADKGKFVDLITFTQYLLNVLGNGTNK